MPVAQYLPGVDEGLGVSLTLRSNAPARWPRTAAKDQRRYPCNHDLAHNRTTPQTSPSDTTSGRCGATVVALTHDASTGERACHWGGDFDQ